MATERRRDRRTRRRVFHIWIGIAVCFALVLALVLPFIRGEPYAYLAGVPVVALNLVLLALALGWLVWYVGAPARRQEKGAGDHRHAGDPGR